MKDFGISQWMRRARAMPDNLRLAAIGAWRGRERGMAVFVGVFLASLVITTVLAYGVGLSQIFFQESLDSEVFDAKIEFRKAPSEGFEAWTNDTDVLIEACAELTSRPEFADCSVILGKKGIHSSFSFGNENILKGMPLVMNSVDTSANPQWTEVSWDYPEAMESGPPITDQRAITLLGPGAFDGVLADRLSENIIHEMGEWASPEQMEAQRGVYLPSNIASEARASVGDHLDNLTFLYTVDSSSWTEESLDEDDCDGEIVVVIESGFTHCMVQMRMENLTVLGVYEPWPMGNPTLPANPIFASWTSLNVSQRNTLIGHDHVYLGMALDRSQLPTESTSEAEDWLEALGRDVESQNYTSENIEFYYVDIVGGTIMFLNIFLGLIQAFDYILMVPIVVLSIAVLVYGLVLSLEQRRREISIHRVIGATSGGLSRMVLLELAVMSSIAWLAGYLLAMAAVPVVLSSVGFMEFSAMKYSVDPRLGFVSTFFTMFATLGLALLFGRARTREFVEMEIDEGVSRVRTERKPRYWLHWIMFSIGMFAVIDTWMEMNGSEDGLNSGWFVEGLLGIFAPFMLWISGAILLGRIGAQGPRIMQFFFGRSPLLSDVKRGLKGSGSTESVNRLATIMLLTLSIVTLAAVQGHTGTIVDERTASVTVGSDLQVTMEDPSSASQVETAIQAVGGTDLAVQAVHVPSIFLHLEGEDPMQTYVLFDDGEDVLHWYDQAIPGDDVDAAMTAYQGMTFSVGEDAAYALDLWGSGRGGRDSDDRGDILLDADNSHSEDRTFIWDEIGFNFSSMTMTSTPHNTSLRYIGVHEFIPGVPTTEMSNSIIIGESSYRSLVGDDAVDNLTATTWIVKVDGVEGESLSGLRANLEADSLFDSAIDWKSEHEKVERNGGLIFGTPGLLSLQFVVASVAAVASAFVFLSLVLNQRQKELAVLQAIGASPNQIIRLVLFEILSIVIVSMFLGVVLGMGLALSFNGLFEVFGFIFQIFGGSETIIQRDLVWPWLQLGIVALSVLGAVVMALLITTRKALRSDLASVLKGE